MTAERRAHRRLAILLPSLLVLTVLGCGRGRNEVDGGEAARPATPPAQAPNVIIYLIDALRADHLGCYGYARPTSPTIDALAREGGRLEAYRAPSSWTKPSVASLFTGLHPLTHGCQTRDDALWEGWLTLAETFAGAGYRTVAIVANPVVHPDLGLAQGFATFRDASDLTLGAGVSSASINRLFLEELDALGGEDARPFFAYLHSMDPHAPYWPKRRYLDAFLDGGDGQVAAGGSDRADPAWRERVAQLMRLDLRQDQRPASPSPEQIGGLTDLYDGEIRQNDDQIGLLVEELRRRGRWENTALIVISDHGEGLFAHRFWAHGNSLHEELVRVPAVVHGPAGRRGQVWRDWTAAARARLVTPMELGAAVVDLALGAGPDPASVNGAWAGRWLGGGPGPEPGLTGLGTLVVDAQRWLSFTDGPWRVLFELRPARSAALYDLGRDPGEARPVDAVARRDALAETLNGVVARAASGLALVVRHAAAGDTVRVRVAGPLRDWIPLGWELDEPGSDLAWADGRLELALAAAAPGDMDAVIVTPVEGREGALEITVECEQASSGGSPPLARLVFPRPRAVAPAAPSVGAAAAGGPWDPERGAESTVPWPELTREGGRVRIVFKAAPPGEITARPEVAASATARLKAGAASAEPLAAWGLADLRPGDVGVAWLPSPIRLAAGEGARLAPEDSVRLDQQMRALGYVR